jgi:hypothetical protein
VAITFILMTVILHVSNNVRLHKFTGICAGALVAAYITIEAPISGMSMNPARTLASALPAQHWTALWIYFTAPLIACCPARNSTSAPMERAASVVPSYITIIPSVASSAASPRHNANHLNRTGRDRL